MARPPYKAPNAAAPLGGHSGTLAQASIRSVRGVFAELARAVDRTEGTYDRRAISRWGFAPKKEMHRIDGATPGHQAAPRPAGLHGVKLVDVQWQL